MDILKHWRDRCLTSANTTLMYVFMYYHSSGTLHCHIITCTCSTYFSVLLYPPLFYVILYLVMMYHFLNNYTFQDFSFFLHIWKHREDKLNNKFRQIKFSHQNLKFGNAKTKYFHICYKSGTASRKFFFFFISIFYSLHIVTNDFV